MIRSPPCSTLTDTPFPYTTLFRSGEDAGDADAEQHRAERQVVAERKPLREQFHHLPSPPAAAAGVGASGVGRLASIFTMRKRSPARTLACALGTWCLVPSRSEERRVGQGCVSTCRSRWSPSH